jgi:heme oxygenase
MEVAAAKSGAVGGSVARASDSPPDVMAAGAGAAEADLADMPLAAALRAATSDWHRRAERSVLVQGWLLGRVDAYSYLRYLSSLRLVYAAIESGLARWPVAGVADIDDAGHRAVRADLARADWRGFFDLRVLARLAAVDADLESWRRWLSDPLADIQPAAAARSLAGRIDSLVRSGDDARLLAHAYVRYLGDLSGGALLAVRLAAAGAPVDGLGLYRFGDAPDAAARAACARAHARSFRDALDAAGCVLGASGRSAVVDEACQAFAWHASMFEQIARDEP